MSAEGERALRTAMTISDIVIDDTLLGHWMMLYIKSCSARIPLATIIESNSTFANVFRIAALAAHPGADRSLLLYALGETEDDCRQTLLNSNPHYGALAVQGCDPLRRALHTELPMRTRKKIADPVTRNAAN